MKWCGKSAPRPRRLGRQGKPHLEQELIGERSLRGMGDPPKCSRVRSLMRLLGNQGPRRMFAARSVGREQNSAYRATPAFFLYFQGVAASASAPVANAWPIAPFLPFVAAPCGVVTAAASDLSSTTSPGLRSSAMRPRSAVGKRSGRR